MSTPTVRHRIAAQQQHFRVPAAALSLRNDSDSGATTLAYPSDRTRMIEERREVQQPLYLLQTLYLKGDEAGAAPALQCYATSKGLIMLD